MLLAAAEPTREQHACMTFIVDCIDSLDRMSRLNLLNEDFLDVLVAIALALDFLSPDAYDMMLRFSLVEDLVASSSSKTAQHLPDTLDNEGNQSHSKLYLIMCNPYLTEIFHAKVSEYSTWMDFSLAVVRSLVSTFDLSEILEHTTTRSSLARSSSSSSSSSSSQQQRQSYMYQLFQRISECDNNLLSAGHPNNHETISCTQSTPSPCSQDSSDNHNTRCLFSKNTLNCGTTTIMHSTTTTKHSLLSPPGSTGIGARLLSKGTRATSDVNHDSLASHSTATKNLSGSGMKKTVTCVLSSQTKLILEDISNYLDSSSSSSSASSLSTTTAAAAVAVDKLRELTKQQSSSIIDTTVLQHSETQVNDSRSTPTFYFSGSSICHVNTQGFNSVHGEENEHGEYERRLFKRKRIMQG